MSNERSLGMKWIAAALAVTGMAAGGWAYARHTTSVAAAAPRAAAASAPASLDTEATPRSRSTRRWQLGDSFVYAVDAARTITMGAPLDHRIDLKLAGALALTVIGVNGDEVRVRADLRQARYEQTPKPPRDPAAELARPFYFTASRAGAFGAYAFPRGMSAEARGLLKGLATSLQVVITGAYEWQTVEQDVSGEYEARYERAGSSIHKAKTRYLRGRSGKGLVPRSDGEYQVRSSNEIDLDDSGWPRSAVEDESLHIKLGEAGVGAVNKATSRLVAVERRLDLAGAADDPNVEPESVSEAAAFALASVQADRALVGGRSFKQITAELTSNDADARSHARARMSALMRLDPQAVGEAKEAILHGDLDPLARSRVIGALGGAGTPESQTALTSILETKSAPVATRVGAAAVIGLVESPTPEAAASLQDAMRSPDREVATTAALALGNTARSLGTTDGAGADAVTVLIARLQAATDDTQRIVYLEALGNTGDARALPAIEPYLTNPDTTLRATATKALKFMTGAEADAAVTRAFGDREIEVRRAAVGTVPFRAVTPVLAALDHLLRAEPEEAIRLAIVNALNLRRREEPVVLDTLRWAAENDPSEKVRKLAQQVLAQPS